MGRKESIVQVGKEFSTNTYGILLVKEIISGTKALVEFKDTGYIRVAAKCDIIAGKVKDLLMPSIYGVGYLGGEVYTKTNSKCAYDRWVSMLCRCFNTDSKNYIENYHRVRVCSEWCNFQNFAKWWYSQTGCANKGWQLDKDILSCGNGLYSPETCCIVPKEINMAVITSRVEGDFKYGSDYKEDLNKYAVRVNRSGLGQRYVGLYAAMEDAAEAYRLEKARYVRELAEKFKEHIDSTVYSKLIEWVVRE